MRLDKLLERLDYEVLQGSVDTDIVTLVNDSREAEKGSAFVCVRGLCQTVTIMPRTLRRKERRLLWWSAK